MTPQAIEHARGTLDEFEQAAITNYTKFELAYWLGQLTYALRAIVVGAPEAADDQGSTYAEAVMGEHAPPAEAHWPPNAGDVWVDECATAWIGLDIRSDTSVGDPYIMLARSSYLHDLRTPDALRQTRDLTLIWRKAAR